MKLKLRDVRFNRSNCTYDYDRLNNNVFVCNFVVCHNLLISDVCVSDVMKVSSFMEKIISYPERGNYAPEKDVIRVKQKYEGMVWVPIDKNARKVAAVCPVRMKMELLKCFVEDTKHFSVISSEGTDLLSKVLMRQVVDKMDKKWLKYTWVNKKLCMGNLSVTVKMDGIRFRPIGMYHKVTFVKVLRYVAVGLVHIIEFCGLESFNLFRTIDLKGMIKNFNDMCVNNDYEIDFKTMDIKSFFTEVQLKFLIPRVKYVLTRFKKHNHSNFVSVPKWKGSKLKSISGFSNSSKFITLSLNMIFDIIVFAGENALFKIGSFILKQHNGLPQGAPTSPPLSCMYVLVDENRHKLIPRQFNVKYDFVLLLIRYADDLLRFVATRKLEEEFIKNVDKYIINELYEHDIDCKNLILVPDDTSKYLDTDIVLYNNKKNVKIVYHNKNGEIINDDYQMIGRFCNIDDIIHIKTKLNTFVNMLIRTIDYTTFDFDCLLPVLQIMYELSLLGFDRKHMLSALTMVNRSRKSDIWSVCASMVECVFV